MKHKAELVIMFFKKLAKDIKSKVGLSEELKIDRPLFN